MAPPICQVKEQMKVTNLGTDSDTRIVPQKVPNMPPRKRALTILKNCKKKHANRKLR